MRDVSLQHVGRVLHTSAAAPESLNAICTRCLQDVLLQYLNDVLARASTAATDSLKPKVDERDVLFVVRKVGAVCVCVGCGGGRSMHVLKRACV